MILFFRYQSWAERHQTVKVYELYVCDNPLLRNTNKKVIKYTFSLL